MPQVSFGFNMEIASARPIERFTHTQQLDNSCHFGAAATLLQFTTGSGADRPSCMFSFDVNMKSSNSTNGSLSPPSLKSGRLLKENAISLSNFTCKRRLDFNQLTLANSYQQRNDIVNNNNNVSISDNNVSGTNENHPTHRSPKSSRHHHHHHHHAGPGSHQRQGRHQNQIKPLTTAVQRRNERERNRVKLINMTFATLRQHLPSGTKGTRSKKMSKVETLKAAIDYIRYLKQLVDEHDVVSAVFDTSGVLTSTPSLSPTSLSSPIPSPSSCSNSSCDGLSVDEEDLLDFSNWF